MNSNNKKFEKIEMFYEKVCKFLFLERNVCEFFFCKNGGRCEIVNVIFFCWCLFGYMGDRCEMGKFCYKV